MSEVPSRESGGEKECELRDSFFWPTARHGGLRHLPNAGKSNPIQVCVGSALFWNGEDGLERAESIGGGVH